MTREVHTKFLNTQNSAFTFSKFSSVHHVATCHRIAQRNAQYTSETDNREDQLEVNTTSKTCRQVFIRLPRTTPDMHMTICSKGVAYNQSISNVPQYTLLPPESRLPLQLHRLMVSLNLGRLRRAVRSLSLLPPRQRCVVRCEGERSVPHKEPKDCWSKGRREPSPGTPAMVSHGRNQNRRRRLPTTQLLPPKAPPMMRREPTESPQIKCPAWGCMAHRTV